MIYIDNAATTFPKPKRVLDEMNFCLKKYCGNPGRSSHQLSLKAAEAVYSTREKVAAMFGRETAECVVFTYNATYALNLAIKSFLTPNCHVLTSDFEHNSVIRPLEKLKQSRGIEYSSFSSDGNIDKNIRSSIRQNTAGIICSLASNVTADYVELSLLSKIAKEMNLFLIIDASQAAGHKEIDLCKTTCDVFCAPGHKALFGIQGCGFAIFKDNQRRESFIEGGSGSDSESLFMPQLLPEAYEAGTLSTPAIVSLGSGIDYINEIGIINIEEKLNVLTENAYSALSSIKGLRIYDSGSGILSFNYKDIPSSIVASMLDTEGICVRGGLHCAPSIHRKIGTLHQGAVRVSFSYLNHFSDIDCLYKAMRKIAMLN